MADWTAFLGPTIGGVCAITALYVRASQAEHATAIAVIKSELTAARQEIRDNYKYCHDANHDTRDLLYQTDLRVQIVASSAGVKLP